MSQSPNNPSVENSKPHYLARTVGLVFVVAGLLVLADQQLKTGWLSLLIFPGIGLTLLIGGIRERQMYFIAPGGLITALGVAGLFLFNPLSRLNWQHQIGYLLLSVGAGAGLIIIISYTILKKVSWWTIFLGTAVISVALTFLLTPLQLTDFALYAVTGIGLSLLAWGVASRLFGLIIPGCLLLGIGPGVYLAWGQVSETSSLARVGIMLVTFAIGWFLIILFSRVLTTKFVWWPLIPGGILAMGGWGLYIGGNPQNAASFIGNTGSIGLIIFGIYLMLMRRGIHN